MSSLWIFDQWFFSYFYEYFELFLNLYCDKRPEANHAKKKIENEDTLQSFKESQGRMLFHEHAHV